MPSIARPRPSCVLRFWTSTVWARSELGPAEMHPQAQQGGSRSLTQAGERCLKTAAKGPGPTRRRVHRRSERQVRRRTHHRHRDEQGTGRPTSGNRRGHRETPPSPLVRRWPISSRPTSRRRSSFPSDDGAKCQAAVLRAHASSPKKGSASLTASRRRFSDADDSRRTSKLLRYARR
jgi:hypothetical protein